MKGEIAEALDLARALHQAGADAADILDRPRRILPFRHPRQDRACAATIRRWARSSASAPAILPAS